MLASGLAVQHQSLDTLSTKALFITKRKTNPSGLVSFSLSYIMKLKWYSRWGVPLIFCAQPL